MAQFPELPSAKPELGVPADQLPVCGSDEPAAEVLTAQADCPTGEAHAIQQAWL